MTTATVDHALLFTDVVDSTLLVERLGDVRAAQVWVEHDRRARDLLAQHHGREIDRTDGFFLLFDSAADAAGYALAYHPIAAELGLHARVGLHVGMVTLRENTPADIARGAKPVEVEGLAKPYAARVMALAEGGRTLLSAVARAAIGVPLAPALAQQADIEQHGHYRLKGIEEPVEIFELAPRAHGAVAPPADSDKAYRVIRVGELWRPVREVRHNLPAERDAFVGRQVELRALVRRLDEGARLLTVLGTGGTGKTRCVVRYAWSRLGDWPGGICFCDLSEARSLDGIFGAVAMALGVPLGSADPAQQLGHAIAGRGAFLMIFDNFEQVAALGPATLGAWLARAPDACFIVTSRERLHLPGEEVFEIEPLPLASDAIALFTARARSQRPGFAIDASNRAAVTEVVRLLDGLPLAIELAAARMRVLSPAQLVEHLRDRFRLLAGARGVAARQATLRAAIDWSWDLLTGWEQSALAQCSVFEGRFTLAAADAVLDLSGWPEAPSAIDAVQMLVDKSLLRSWFDDPAGRFGIDEPYFGMYVSIHEYAASRLDVDAKRAADVRHGHYFARFGSVAAIEALNAHGSLPRRRELAVELDNLVVACRRAVTRDDAPVAVDTFRAAWAVIDLQGPLALSLTLGREVLALASIDPERRARACFDMSISEDHSGHIAQGYEFLLQARAHARESGSLAVEGAAEGQLGQHFYGLGDTQAAFEHYDAALRILRGIGDRRGEGIVLGNLGNMRIDIGRIEHARTHYEAAIAIHREVGNRRAEGIVLGNLGGVHLDQGRLDEARALYDAALAIHVEVGNRRSASVAHVNLGTIVMQQGDLAGARMHYETALAEDREIGARGHEAVVLGHLASVWQAYGDLAAGLDCTHQALVIAREVGNRRVEVFLLTNLAELRIEQGQLAPARAALVEAETLGRALGDVVQLAKLLCVRGSVDLIAGDAAQARAALAEAETIAVSVQAGPESEIRTRIEQLRAALA